MGGNSSFTPTKKKGGGGAVVGGRSFSHAEGGQKQFWGSLAMTKRRGGGRGNNIFRLRVPMHFVAPPPPVINDRSLRF